MASKLTKRADLLGTVLVDENGTPQGVYTRCPHCGMIDLRHSSQGIRQSHFQSWKVKGVGKYECGKCRHTFYTLEIQVPAGMEPMALYEQLNTLLQRKDEVDRHV